MTTSAVPPVPVPPPAVPPPAVAPPELPRADDEDGVRLLGAGDLRRLADELGLRPRKSWGQNFVHDANTVRRVVAAAGVRPGETVLEVGPGLGSLTLALLAAGAHVTAVEVDPVLAGRLPGTVARQAPQAAGRLAVLAADAVHLDAAALPGPTPTALVANLPYNVAVPVLLRCLAVLPALRTALVMVQSEVADRLVSPPGSRTYGAPSLKVAWYGDARRVGAVPRPVFWPVPGVDSALVRVDVTPAPVRDARDVPYPAVAGLVDAAFSQRRKTLRAALAGWAGSAAAAEQVLRAAGVEPSRRGETLTLPEVLAVARARRRPAAPRVEPA